MATEEQLTYDQNIGMYAASNPRMGQAFENISNRTIVAFSFRLKKEGLPTGSITYEIWTLGTHAGNEATATLLASKVLAWEKATGAITGGPFTVGETIDFAPSGASGPVITQDGGSVTYSGTGADAGDTGTGADSGATINGSLTVASLSDAADLTIGYLWYEATLDTPYLVNQNIMMMVKYNAGDASNKIRKPSNSTNVKNGDNEYECRFSGALWELFKAPQPQRDGTYKYTYQTGATVTTQAMTDVVGATATGNGDVTSLGDGTVSAHGHTWNTTGTPDIDSDTFIDNGAKGSTGAFTSALVGLPPGTLIYVRAFATTEYGTSYGNEVQFSTPGGGTQPDEGRVSGGPVTFAQHFVLVDWDDDDDFTDDESDITADVLETDIERGKDRELGHATAAFLTLEVKNTNHKYSPPNSNSVLNQGGRTLKPGHKVLVGMSFPYDEFVDADGVALANHYPTVPYDPASLWSEEAGTWVIDTNQVKDSSGGSEGIAVMETEEADAHISVKFKKGADNDAIICFRYGDIENYLEVRTTATDIAVWKMDGHVLSPVATVTFAWAIGDTKAVKVILHGKYIYVLVDRALKISTESTLNVTETKHGIGGANIHSDARFYKWGCAYQLFYGRIDNINPNTDPSIRTAYIEASDDFRQLAGTTLKRRVYPVGGFPEGTDAFIEEILKNSVGNVAQEGYIFDSGVTITAAGSTKAWWDVKALDECHDIEKEENGFFYQDPDGLWRFENRTHRTTTPHDASIKTFYAIRATNGMFFTGLKWRSGSEDVINRVTVSVQRSERTSSAGEVWRAREADVVDGGVSSSDLDIGAGATKVVYFESKDFDAIAGLISPASTTDYVANAAADGTGTDKTGSLTVTLATVDASDVFNFGKGGKLTLDNADGATIYVTKLKVRGDGYKLKERVSAYEEDTTSQGNYGERSHEVDAKLFTTWNLASSLAIDIEDKEDDPRAKVDIVMQNSTKEALTQILARRLSDRVTLNWSDFGVNEGFHINRIRHHIYNVGASVDCTMTLEEVS